MNNTSTFFQSNIQQTLNLTSQINQLTKQRDALRKQREALELSIDDAELQRRHTVVMELSEARDEIHADWWAVVKRIEELRQQQSVTLKATA